jgi:hypothetical protein
LAGKFHNVIVGLLAWYSEFAGYRNRDLFE